MRLEFKGERQVSLNDRDLTVAVVCLANCEGGLVIVRVEDSGEVAGARHRQSQATGLMEWGAGPITPPERLCEPSPRYAPLWPVMNEFGSHEMSLNQRVTGGLVAGRSSLRSLYDPWAAPSRENIRSEAERAFRQFRIVRSAGKPPLGKAQ